MAGPIAPHSDHRPLVTLLLLYTWFLGIQASAWILFAKTQRSYAAHAYPSSLLDADAAVLLIALLPFCWHAPALKPLDSSSLPSNTIAERVGAICSRIPRPAWHIAACTLLLLAHTACSWNAGAQELEHGRTFVEASPHIHDEFSYLFQAETFLAGRWYYPGAETAPEIFHSTHIMNEGRFASRYPPGTGLYLAAFIGWTSAVFATRAAHLFACLMLYRIGYRLGGHLAGFVAGLVFAIAPNQAVLSNMSVAHGPTMIGLTLFLDGYLTFLNGPSRGVAILGCGATKRALIQAGCGMAFAMLCRPMAAAGFCLPFGLHWMSQLFRMHGVKSAGMVRTVSQHFAQWWLQSFICFGLPLLAAFGILAWQSSAILGSPWSLVYSRYTELYTPRHVYGFGNGSAVSVGDPSNVLDDYNAWARNLTPRSSIRVAWQRLKASLSWTFGAVPLVGVSLAVALLWSALSLFCRLLAASLVTLQLAHIPYWFDGLFGHHYIFEAILAWSLLAGAIVTLAIADRCRRGRSLFVAWVVLAFVHQGVAHHITVPSMYHESSVHLAASNAGHFAPAYHRFAATLQQDIPDDETALVIVRQAPEHIHVEFTRSRPPFDERILVGRERSDRYPFDRLQQLFPNRSIYLYDSRENRLRAIENVAQERNHRE